MSATLFFADETTPLGVLMPSIWYNSVIPGVPDILLMRREECCLPDAGMGDLSEHFKAVYSETASDRRYLNDCLAKPLPTRNGIGHMADSVGKTNLRRSGIPDRHHPLLVQFDPPEHGWPYLFVLMMPSVQTGNPRFSRGRYMFEAYASELALVARTGAVNALTQQLGAPSIDLTGR